MKKITTVLTFILFLSAVSAQTSINATGGNASGSGGSVSYTVGQTVYTTETGTNGNSIAQGVQQPYEISVVTGISEAKGISISVSAYPNPTTDYLTVKIGNYETANLQYKVFDINGKLLQSVIGSEAKQTINMQNYPASTYFVKVIDKEKEIKVFKIIKK